MAQSIVDPANPKTALSVCAMLTANIGAMDLFPDEGRPFPIRNWIECGGRGGFPVPHTARRPARKLTRHTHAALPNMVHGPDGKWRTMATESLYCERSGGAYSRR